MSHLCVGGLTHNRAPDWRGGRSTKRENMRQVGELRDWRGMRGQIKARHEPRRW